MTAQPNAPTAETRKPGVRRTVALGIGIVVFMTGLAFAAPPLYDLFCRVTGYGGTTQVATAAPSAVLTRTIAVHFDANVMPGLPLQFRPLERTQTVRFGEVGVVRYLVRNTSDAPVEAIATYNVAPHKTGIFFQKLECFCFTNRVIPAGAEVELPVVYFIRPEMLEDRAARGVEEVTLSYTFFPASQGQNLPPLQPVS